MKTRIKLGQLAAATALLAVFPVQGIRAQQAPLPANAAQPVAAAQPAAVSVPGAPAPGFHIPELAVHGVADTAVQSASPAPAAPFQEGIDPITGTPFSTLAARGAREAGSGQTSTLSSDGSLHQGFKVHGHWVINIRNPDGTLVQHHEFENSLEPSAQGFLVGLLSGFMVPGDWMIALGAQSGNAACVGNDQFCGLVHNFNTEPAQGYCGKYYCTGSTLNYAYNFGTNFEGPYSIVLTGSITANQTGTVGTVYTLLNFCANGGPGGGSPNGIATASPASCVTQTSPPPWYGPFTDANVPPVSVTDGQLIQVIVTITFS
jgi:hypothetical protein